MQYILLIHSNEAAVKSAPKEATERMHAAYMAYTEALARAGVVVGGNRLRPSSATTTVRLVDGKTQVLDGPYAETKEQIAGYYLIEVPDMDAALSWAARCPGANGGAIEVRPIWPNDASAG
ncbi:MAG TPA: YciI family protein [Acetobacteraceae bacterium]|nr:YciI family protein [Acetobacteraceae bacterium]